MFTAEIAEDAEDDGHIRTTDRRRTQIGTDRANAQVRALLPAWTGGLSFSAYSALSAVNADTRKETFRFEIPGVLTRSV